ncbi:hypothetical protein BU17DRAFT_85596 [Hysterangium stoloniferum]|nr:hypothetical protein BU17DRAFT_85596 [Hysterangium stoloniferum]
MSWDITVHHLTDDPIASISDDILTAAQNLIEASVASSIHWHPVSSSSSFHYTSSSKAQCFTLAREPPRIKLKASFHLSQLPDWDASCSDDEETTNLLEFESTNFNPGFEFIKRRPFKRKLPLQGLHVDRRFANDVDINAEQRSYKRIRPPYLVASLSISISTLIAYPHYHASPYPANPPPPGIDEIPEFRVKRRISHVHLETPFARTAWLVPLRGDHPIGDASDAQLYESLPSDKSHDGIQWIPCAITQFWAFLLRQRSMNNFGPIAIAYTFGPAAAVVETLKKGSAQQSTWEYIKIYHDSRYALKLRSVLDSFRWEDQFDDHRRHQIQRHRVLKGSTLILVDEKGNPILLA